MNSHDKEIRDAVKVDLKEHLQVLVREQDRRIEQATRDSERALKLQAGEYDRRLHELNNEAARLQAAVARNVSADTWSAFETTYRDDQRRIATRLDNFGSRLDWMYGGLSVVTIIGIANLVKLFFG